MFLSSPRRWVWVGLAALVAIVVALLWPSGGGSKPRKAERTAADRPQPFAPRVVLGPNGWQIGPRRVLGPIAVRPVADGLVRVTGTVFDLASHKVVGDVEVVFADGTTEASAIADVAGRYSIDVPAGRYRPFVRADGVISASTPLRERLPARPRPDQVAAARLDLAYAIDLRQSTDGVDLEVVRSGKVAGRVIDRSGNPIMGAVVRAYATDEPSTPRPILGPDVAETGADGRFDLEVAAATYRLDAYHDRYGGIAAAAVVYVAPAETADAELTMMAGCVISGRVVRADGQPMSRGALERAYGNSGDNFYPDGDFADDGTFQWSTTEEIEISLRAWPWKSTHSEPRRFDCRDGARYDNVMFEIPRAEPDLAGRVVTADGTPIPFAYVDIGGISAGTMNQQERADADGNWAVFALPDGEYRVTATADGAGAVERVVTAPNAGIELRMSGIGTLAGKVKGIVDGSFTIDVYACTPTADTGGVHLEYRRVVPVSGGQYALEGVPACHQLAVAVSHGSHRVIMDTSVPVGGVGTLDIDVADPEPVTVRGVVRGADGRGVARAIVTVVSAMADDGGGFVEADDNGRYTLQAHAGDQLAARGPDGGFGLRWLERDSPSVVDLDVVLDPTDEHQPHDDHDDHDVRVEELDEEDE